MLGRHVTLVNPALHFASVQWLWVNLLNAPRVAFINVLTQLFASLDRAVNAAINILT